MNVSPSKEQILKKIRKALTASTPIPFPEKENAASVFPAPLQELELEFAEQFTKLQGKFVFCANRQELIENLAQLAAFHHWSKIWCGEPQLQELLKEAKLNIDPSLAVDDCEAAVTGCEALVARTGSIMLHSGTKSGRSASVYAPVHICVASTDQVVYEIRDALRLFRENYGAEMPSMISFASGPSRTADIEKTLVVGVHGPGEVYCFLVDEKAG